MSEIPSVITPEMRQRLRELGIPHHQINQLEPAVAWAKIQAAGAWKQPGWTEAAKDYQVERGDGRQAPVNMVWPVTLTAPAPRPADEYDGLPATFAEACAQADQDIAPAETVKLVSAQALLDEGVSLERTFRLLNAQRRSKGAPTVTVEAIMYHLEHEGPSAITRKWMTDRLGSLNSGQLEEICTRLAKQWCKNDIARLVDVWGGLDG
jgi:hypothetical protein